MGGLAACFPNSSRARLNIGQTEWWVGRRAALVHGAVGSLVAQGNAGFTACPTGRSLHPRGAVEASMVGPGYGRAALGAGAGNCRVPQEQTCRDSDHGFERSIPGARIGREAVARRLARSYACRFSVRNARIRRAAFSHVGLRSYVSRAARLSFRSSPRSEASLLK